MVWTRIPRIAFALACLVGTAAAAGPVWVVDPGNTGPDAPAEGRSLFDHLTIQDGRQEVPYPFEALLERLDARLDDSDPYLGRTLKKVLIPLGRSLQREAAAPGYFDSPRLVVAVDTEPAASAGDGGMLLRDRLYIGYLEAADVLEVISYNERAARFEFQVVRDYRAGGTAQVRYARRAVCMACHQNAAPIFARPLWDETNANADVARRIAARHQDFHGVPARTGVDVAYAIDNATDRANGLALTQRLWQEGCGAGRVGARCRRALLVRALQYALGGRRGYDRSSANYLGALRDVMEREGRARWPEGLLLPDADIANRRPLQGYDRPPGGEDPERLRGRADVAAPFEPLVARPPIATWTPDPDDLVERAVTGLVEFLARPDIERIDALLAGAEAGERRVAAECDSTREYRPGQTRIKLDCQGEGLSLRGLLYRTEGPPGPGELSGRLRGVRVGGEDLGAMGVAGDEIEDGGLAFTLARAGSPVLPRLSGGDALAGLTLRWPAAGDERSVLEVRIRRDFPLLEDAIERLAQRDPRLFAAGPFQRAELVPALLASLGAAPQRWCCAQAIAGPPPQAGAVEPPPDDPPLRPFFQVCGGCHRSDEAFPPNFLAGSAAQVRTAVGHCAERIRYRLAMWDLEPGQRPKSPMPPQHAGSLDGERLEQWRRGLLPSLRRALDQVAAAESPAPVAQQVAARPYSTLRRCLPAS